MQDARLWWISEEEMWKRTSKPLGATVGGGGREVWGSPAARGSVPCHGKGAGCSAEGERVQPSSALLFLGADWGMLESE